MPVFNSCPNAKGARALGQEWKLNFMLGLYQIPCRQSSEFKYQHEQSFFSGLEEQCWIAVPKLHSLMLYNIPDQMEKKALQKFCFVLGKRGTGLAY